MPLHQISSLMNLSLFVTLYFLKIKVDFTDIYIMGHKLLVYVLMLLITAIPGSAMASSTFYIVSPATGSDHLLEFTLDNIVNETIEITGSTPLTLHGEVPYFFTNSLAFSPTGELYAWSAKDTSTDPYSALGQLYTIDRATGAINLIGEPQGAPLWVNGLTFDSTGTLYGLAAHLYTIDTSTGIRTQISTDPIGVGHRGLAHDFETDELYAWTGLANITDQLLRIDKTTGATTNVPIDFNVSSCCIGTEFNPDTGEMITIRGGNRIYSTNIDTGHGTYLGRVSWDGNYVGSNSLAVLPGTIVVPEPISSILFLTGGAALGFRRSRKRAIAQK